MPGNKKADSEELENKARRKKPQRREEDKAMEIPGTQAALSDVMAQDPAALLSSRQMAHPASAPLRAQATQELQKQRGNAYVQQVIKRIQADKGSGQPIPRNIRSKMQQSLGYNFEGVRLHTDGAAHNAAEGLDAKAFTMGRDIFLDQRHGQNLASTEGKRILAHELTHVVQQAEGNLSLPGEKVKMGQPGDVYEREADATAENITGGVDAVSSSPLQRKVEEREEAGRTRWDSMAVQRQVEEEEEEYLQTKPRDTAVQRQVEEEEEEEYLQPKLRDTAVQRQSEEEEEEEEYLQAKPLSRSQNMMLQRQQALDRRFVPRDVPAIQRKNGGGTAGGPTPQAPTQQEPVILNLREVTLRPLREYPIHITNPATMNQDAVTLWGHLRNGEAQSSDLRFELGYLQYSEQTGASQLGAVRGARGALQASTRGRGGQYVRNAVETYINANRDVSAKLNRVRASQAAIASAAAGLRAVVLEGRELQAGREVSAAQSDVAAIQRRINSAKSQAGIVIGTATNLLQGKWVSAGIDLAKFAGTQLFQAGVEAAYAPQLAQAQANLREARDNLTLIQNERQAAALEREVANLRSVNLEADARQDELIGAAQRAELAYTTLTETLRNMGYPDAAAALDARMTVMQAADRSLRKLTQYEEKITTIRRISNHLKILNRGLASLMVGGSADALVPDSTHQIEMFAAADYNAGVLGQIEEWTQGEITNIGNARTYVEGGTYLREFEAIDVELRQALTSR